MWEEEEGGGREFGWRGAGGGLGGLVGGNNLARTLWRQACYAVQSMNSPAKCSGRWLVPPTECERIHRSVDFTSCQFSPCPNCRKCLTSQTENISPTGKHSPLKEQMTGLPIAVLRVSVGVCSGMTRTLMQDCGGEWRGYVAFFFLSLFCCCCCFFLSSFFFFRQCLLREEML